MYSLPSKRNRPPYLFHSHVEMIASIARDHTPQRYSSAEAGAAELIATLRAFATFQLITILRAFANINLAFDEQHEDFDAIEDAIENGEASDLCVWLHDRGACPDGLTTAGQYVTEESLERILWVRDDWHDWYREQLCASPAPD